jgi:hypothetical protein
VGNETPPSNLQTIVCLSIAEETSSLMSAIWGHIAKLPLSPEMFRRNTLPPYSVYTNCFYSFPSLRRSVGLPVKLLLAFASTVIHGFSFLWIHDQNFYSLLDMYVFRNGASSPTEWSVFLCRIYVCCVAVSARAYPLCHGVQVTMDSVSLHYTK